MAWLQIVYTIDGERVDELSEALFALNASAVTVKDAGDEPIFEPKPDEIIKWTNSLVIALYPAESDIDKIITSLDEQFAENPLPQPQITPLEDRDWTREWMRDFKPLQFGKKLWICPSWCDIPDPQACNIMLDPGLAFGTGTHPTTAMCLEYLDSHPPKDLTVIDYGCGSGILAIAAAKLGAEKVYAVDNHPQALIATRYNSETNKVPGPQLSIYLPDDFAKQKVEPVDVLIANILLQPLLNLATLFSTLVKPNGRIVLSGILEEQVPLLMETYQNHFAFSINKTNNTNVREQWCCLVGIKID